PPVCYTARAIEDDAFEDDISTFHDLLHRPILEDRDYVPFKWKGHVLDKPIFPLLKQRLFDLWHRTLLVAGVRNPPRLYSLRVGAGARLDGKNEPSVRRLSLSLYLTNSLPYPRNPYASSA